MTADPPERPDTLPAPERCPDCGSARVGLDEARSCPECGFEPGRGAVTLQGRGFHGSIQRNLGLAMLFYGLGGTPIAGSIAGGVFALAGAGLIVMAVVRRRHPESVERPDRLVLTIHGVGRGQAGERLEFTPWSAVTRFRVGRIVRWRLTRTAPTLPTAVVSITTMGEARGLADRIRHRGRGHRVQSRAELPRGGIEALREHCSALFAARRPQESSDVAGAGSAPDPGVPSTQK